MVGLARWPRGCVGDRESGQDEVLCDVTEGFFHRLVSNLDHSPKDSSSNPGGKGKQVGLFLGLGLGAQPRVNATSLLCIGGPVIPPSSSHFIVHRRSSNRCPRSIEIMLDQRPEEGGWTLSQQGRCCGSGYDVVKWVRKSFGHNALGLFSKM